MNLRFHSHRLVNDDHTPAGRVLEVRVGWFFMSWWIGLHTPHFRWGPRKTMTRKRKPHE